MQSSANNQFIAKRRISLHITMTLVLGCACAVGCASSKSAGTLPHPEWSLNNAILVGEENQRLDKLEHTLMAPRRWVRQLRGKQTIAPSYVRSNPPAIALDYLAGNGISGVNIDVDVYQPKLQWQRLRDADHVGPIAKYTLGTLSLVRDAALPGRVFNQDRYNHFTKTLSLNSTNEASALYEAAMVNEHFAAPHLGSATVAQRLPIGTTIARVRAGNDALKFARNSADAELESELYPIVYSSVVSEALGDVGVFTDISLSFPQRLVARIGARQVGKAVGSMQKRSAEEKIASTDSETRLK